MAAYSLALERPNEARAFAREALDAALALRAPDLIALSEQHLASVAALSGDFSRAALLLGHVDACYESIGLKRDTSELVTYERLRRDLASGLDDAALQTRLAAGAAMHDDQAVAEARRV